MTVAVASSPITRVIPAPPLRKIAESTVTCGVRRICPGRPRARCSALASGTCGSTADSPRSPLRPATALHHG